MTLLQIWRFNVDLIFAVFTETNGITEYMISFFLNLVCSVALGVVHAVECTFIADHFVVYE